MELLVRVVAEILEPITEWRNMVEGVVMDRALLLVQREMEEVLFMEQVEVVEAEALLREMLRKLRVLEGMWVCIPPVEVLRLAPVLQHVPLVQMALREILLKWEQEGREADLIPIVPVVMVVQVERLVVEEAEEVAEQQQVG
jgi:hypothetical protein